MLDPGILIENVFQNTFGRKSYGRDDVTLDLYFVDSQITIIFQIKPGSVWHLSPHTRKHSNLLSFSNFYFQ